MLVMGWDQGILQGLYICVMEFCVLMSRLWNNCVFVISTNCCIDKVFMILSLISPEVTVQGKTIFNHFMIEHPTLHICSLVI